MRHLLLLCTLAMPAMAQERTVVLHNTEDQEFCINAAPREAGPVSVGRCDGDNARFVLRGNQPGIRLSANPAFCLSVTVGGEPTYLTIARCAANGEFQRLLVEPRRIFTDEFGPACVAAPRGVTAGARITTADCADNARQRWSSRVIAAATGPAAWGRASGWDITMASAGGQFRGCQAERRMEGSAPEVGPVRITLNPDLVMMMDYPYGITITQAERIVIRAGNDRDTVTARPSGPERISFEITPPVARTLVERNTPHLRIEIPGNEADRVPTAGFRAVWDMLNDCVDKRGVR